MMTTELKNNYLLEKIPAILAPKDRGTVLDLGCGWGNYSAKLSALGFDVTAADMNPANFRFHDKIQFQQCNLTEPLLFVESTFDYLLFIETIEHLERPFDVIGELSRVLKPGGTLILSTPNVLNVGSRLRFLFEGGLDFFREPPLDFQEHYIGTIENIHIIPWRYQDLEYLLYRQGFAVQGIHADVLQPRLRPLYYMLAPLMLFQRRSKEHRSTRKGGLNYRRINSILFSKELLFGKHLIVEAVNVKVKGQPFGYFNKAPVRKFQPA